MLRQKAFASRSPFVVQREILNQSYRVSLVAWPVYTLLCHHYHLDLGDLSLYLLDSELLLVHLRQNALGKLQLLHLYHLMAHRAKIEQIEDVDLEDLIVRQLIKSVLKLRLFSAQIGPDRVLELRLKVVWHEFSLSHLLLLRLSFCKIRMLMRRERFCFRLDVCYPFNSVRELLLRCSCDRLLFIHFFFLVDYSLELQNRRVLLDLLV